MENNLENLTKFYPGQKVICINPSLRLIKDEIYTVVGFSSNGLGVIVKEAQSEFIINGFWPWRFRAQSESPFPSLTFKEVIEKEKVLTCNN